MKTPDDNELRQILLVENGGSVSSGICGGTASTDVGGVYAYAGPPVDQWAPPGAPQVFQPPLSWPCTMDVPSLTDEIVKDLLARVQRLEQQVADLMAKKPRVRRKKPA